MSKQQPRGDWWVGWNTTDDGRPHDDVFQAPYRDWRPKADGSWGSYDRCTGPYETERAARTSAAGAMPRPPTFREWADLDIELKGLLRTLSSSQVTPEILSATRALIAALKRKV